MSQPPVNQSPKIDRQREHQANERTFLAWVRTSIALISFGLAIARFGLFLRELQQGMTQTVFAPHPVSSQTIGLVLVLAGMVMILLAAWSYNQAFWQIERGNYKPNRWIIWITTLGMLMIGALSLPFVLWQPPANQGSGQRKSQIDRLYRNTSVYRPGKIRRQNLLLRVSSQSMGNEEINQELGRSARVASQRVSPHRFSGSRRMKLYRHRSLGKRQTMA